MEVRRTVFKKGTFLSQTEIFAILNASDSELSDDEASHEIQTSATILPETDLDVTVDAYLKKNSDLTDHLLEENHQLTNNDEITSIEEAIEEHESCSTAILIAAGSTSENVEAVIVENVDFEIIDHFVCPPVTDKSKIRWRRREFECINTPFEESMDNSPDDKLNTSPTTYFFKYMTKNLFEDMARYTNLYAGKNKDVSFKSTNGAELIKFVGIKILMGNLKLSRLKTYWNKNLGISPILNAMSFERFLQLRTNLHFIDKDQINKNCEDKLILVRPLINAVQKRCLEHDLEEVLSIDEQIIPFKGHLSIKQYVKGKPCPWGIKVFVLCGKSGLPYDFVVYQGSNTEITQENKNKFGFGAAVVLHLGKRITNPGHSLYFDNYFSSYQLFEMLKHLQINATGTIRINRFTNPPHLSDKDLKLKGRGASDEVTSLDGKICVVKWQDNKTVYLASNCVGIGEEKIVNRWDKVKKQYVQIKQPEIVHRYNNGMGGVDLLDQLISYYRIFIKSKKWPLRVVTHFIDFAIAASWIEYKNDKKKYNQKDIMDLYEFRLHLASALITADQTKKRGRPPNMSDCDSPEPSSTRKKKYESRPIDDIRFDSVNHFPIHDQGRTASRCKFPQCSGRSRILCEKCQIHLCLNANNNCFYKYHKQTD